MQAVRAAQATSTLCENPTPCRFGDRCMFAHSLEEAERFRDWRPHAAHGLKATKPASPEGVPSPSSVVNGHVHLPRRRSGSRSDLQYAATAAAAQQAAAAAAAAAAAPWALPQQWGEEEQGVQPKFCHPQRYKTEMCIFWQRGTCRHGDMCTYAHGPKDVRAVTSPSHSSGYTSDTGSGEVLMAIEAGSSVPGGQGELQQQQARQQPGGHGGYELATGQQQPQEASTAAQGQQQTQERHADTGLQQQEQGGEEGAGGQVVDAVVGVEGPHAQQYLAEQQQQQQPAARQGPQLPDLPPPAPRLNGWREQGEVEQQQECEEKEGEQQPVTALQRVDSLEPPAEPEIVRAPSSHHINSSLESCDGFPTQSPGSNVRTPAPLKQRPLAQSMSFEWNGKQSSPSAEPAQVEFQDRKIEEAAAAAAAAGAAARASRGGSSAASDDGDSNPGSSSDGRRSAGSDASVRSSVGGGSASSGGSGSGGSGRGASGGSGAGYSGADEGEGQQRQGSGRAAPGPGGGRPARGPAAYASPPTQPYKVPPPAAGAAAAAAAAAGRSPSMGPATPIPTSLHYPSSSPAVRGAARMQPPPQTPHTPWVGGRAPPPPAPPHPQQRRNGSNAARSCLARNLDAMLNATTGPHGRPDLSMVPHFVCPLSGHAFHTPVVAADGITYEKYCISDWLYRQDQEISPITGQRLAHRLLLPNDTLKRAMDDVAELLRALTTQ